MSPGFQGTFGFRRCRMGGPCVLPNRWPAQSAYPASSGRAGDRPVRIGAISYGRVLCPPDAATTLVWEGLVALPQKDWPAQDRPVRIRPVVCVEHLPQRAGFRCRAFGNRAHSPRNIAICRQKPHILDFIRYTGPERVLNSRSGLGRLREERQDADYFTTVHTRTDGPSCRAWFYGDDGKSGWCPGRGKLCLRRRCRPPWCALIPPRMA